LDRTGIIFNPILIREVVMKVAVFSPKGRMLTIYPIVLGGLNYQPTEKDYFAKAKEQAVEDGLVSEKDANSLTFKLLDE
jgi:hypothetical protein